MTIVGVLTTHSMEARGIASSTVENATRYKSDSFQCLNRACPFE